MVPAWYFLLLTRQLGVYNIKKVILFPVIQYGLTKHCTSQEKHPSFILRSQISEPITFFKAAEFMLHYLTDGGRKLGIILVGGSRSVRLAENHGNCEKHSQLNFFKDCKILPSSMEKCTIQFYSLYLHNTGRRNKNLNSRTSIYRAPDQYFNWAGMHRYAVPHF